MNKETLIEKLKDVHELEDDLVIEDEQFYKFMTKESGLSDEERKKIEDLFDEVVEDTKRHRDIFINLEEEIKNSQNNEF